VASDGHIKTVADYDGNGGAPHLARHAADGDS
jgi:hypothetical protein